MKHQNILYAGEIVIPVILMLLMLVFPLKKMYHLDKLLTFIAKLAGDAAQPLLYATWSLIQFEIQLLIGVFFLAPALKFCFNMQVHHKQMTPEAAYKYLRSIRPRVLLASAQWKVCLGWASFSLWFSLRSFEFLV